MSKGGSFFGGGSDEREVLFSFLKNMFVRKKPARTDIRPWKCIPTRQLHYVLLYSALASSRAGSTRSNKTGQSGHGGRTEKKKGRNECFKRRWLIICFFFLGFFTIKKKRMTIHFISKKLVLVNRKHHHPTSQTSSTSRFLDPFKEFRKWILRLFVFCPEMGY